MKLEESTHYIGGRLREPTKENIQEDLELLKMGVLDHFSFYSGYQKGHNLVEIVVYSPENELKRIARTHNLRTNAGTADQGHIISDSSSSVAKAYYIALTGTTITPNTTDTSLSGELSTYNLGRKAATFALTGAPSSSSTSTLQGTFTLSASWVVATGAPNQTIWGCAVFNAASGPDMWFEAAIASPGVSVGASDTINLVYTINY